MIAHYHSNIFISLISLLVIFDHATCTSLFPINACQNDLDYPFWFLSGNKCWYNPDVVSDVPAMVARHGYKSETHVVVTSDEYILTLFRVLPNGISNGIVLYMQHGIAADCSCFCDKGNESHAFVFADQGYEIWLGNTRGSRYSKGHVSLSIKNQAYWNFTLDTLASIDIRVMLQYVKNVSQSDSIYYIGHSMGTTLGFMYLSEFPEESKVTLKGMTTLAPVVYLYYSRALAPVPLLLTTIKTFYKGGVLYGENTNRIVQDVCTVIPTVCRLIIELLFGKTEQLPAKYLLLLFNSHLRGSGIYMFNQYAQFISDKKFQKYNWGKKRNLELYGSATPPVYDLTKVQVPVSMYWGKNDPLTSAEAVNRLTSELGKYAKIVRPFAEGGGISFNHADFLYAEKLRELVLDVISQDIKSVA